MYRVDVLNHLLKDLGVHQKGMAEEFTKFATENKDLDDADFYAKFKNQFAWIEFIQQSNRSHNLRIITNILIYFIIVSIIGVIATIVIAASGSGA